MIVIIGASGAVGIPTIKVLVSRGAEVRALTSNQNSATRLKELGVAQCFIGDFMSDDDVAGVIKGAEQVMQIPPRFNEHELEISKRCFDAAKAAGVSHYLFLSAYHSQMQKVAHHWNKLLAEEHLIESDMPFTIIKPSMFMQNIRVEWPRIVKDGVYARPYSPDKKMSVIDTVDLGEAAANILTDPSLRGATYDLCGPGPLTHTEMAQIISEELGKKVDSIHRDIEDWRAFALKNKWTDFAIKSYIAMCHHYDTHGYPGGNTVTLKALLGREPNDYRSFIRVFIAEHG